MGNVSGRTAIEMVNTLLGLTVETGLLNILFEIFDGDLIVETIEGDGAVDPTDFNRLHLMMGCAVFGGQNVQVSQALRMPDDPEAARARFHELIDGFAGETGDDVDLARAVNKHPQLRTLVAFTLEQGADGAAAYRLYRHPDVERGRAMEFLRNLRNEFRAKAAASAASDVPKN